MKPSQASPSREPRVPLIDQASDPEAAALFAGIQKRTGRLLNLHRMTANSPTLMQASLEFALALRHGTQLTRRLTELVVLRIAQLKDSAYEWQQHEGMAQDAGCTAEDIDALDHWRDSSRFSEPERAALAWCECVVNETDASEDDFDLLRRHFSSRQIVELTALACHYISTAHFVRALALPLEAPRKPA